MWRRSTLPPNKLYLTRLRSAIFQLKKLDFSRAINPFLQIFEAYIPILEIEAQQPKNASGLLRQVFQWGLSHL
jgi:hypothetical protein